jgi:catechol 2,3-dioxygenase-like lactoylglutathione lyase family enzyme
LLVTSLKFPLFLSKGSVGTPSWKVVGGEIMRVKGLTWLGLRTTQFNEMVKFFREVMGMTPIRDEPGIAGFQMTDGTNLELYDLDEKSHAFFTTGPVVAFRVDDVAASRATMEAAGIEFIGSIQRMGKSTWNHFRAPDGTVFEILASAGDKV